MIFFAWMLAAAPMAVLGQTRYLESLTLENSKVEKVGRSVRVNAGIRLDAVELNRQQTLRLVPVLVSADGTEQMELKPVVLEGKVRKKVTERKIALGTISEEEGLVRIKRRNGKPQTVDYSAEVPFSRWMVNGRLELRAYVTGCAECSEGDEVLAAGGILPYREPVLAVSPFVRPEEEEVKRRAEVKTARLQYPVNGYNVLPDFRTNRAELDSVQHSLDLVKGNRNLTVTGIYVTGYASPEASMAYNLRLSQKRAETFATYVQKLNLELKKDLWHVDWKGEDWVGLRKEVEKHPQLLKQQEVLAIIDNCEGDYDACEAKFKALQPSEIYQRLVNEMYAPLRRNEYRIEYNVRSFDLEEAKEMLKTRPDLLSVAEIQRVADSYGRNSDGYRKALDVAVRTYPENFAARNNAALAAVETEHYAEAIALLKDARDGASLNLLGVAYWKSGQADKAEEAFARAVEAGYGDAAGNLKQLQEAKALFSE